MLMLMLALAVSEPNTCKNDDFWMESVTCETHCAYLEMGFECADKAVEKLQCECAYNPEKEDKSDDKDRQN